MTHYKLTYFNGRGRAEIIRLVFAAAGVQYEDVRIEKEQWPELKPKTPFGQLPILEFDGVTLCQSKAIARYLAHKFNLAGKTEMDQIRADMIVDCIEDVTRPWLAYRFLTDETKKAELEKKFKDEQLPSSLALLEQLVKENKNGDGYFVGDELTWVDLALVVLEEWLSRAGVNTAMECPKHPKLNALFQRVQQLPRVADWLAKRPVTEF